MIYDTGVPTSAAYSGYVRLQTQLALSAVPAHVTLLIGLPAHHDSEPGHTSGETVAAAIRGVRLALGAHPPRRRIGVAICAEFTATPADWAAYFTDWARRNVLHPLPQTTDISKMPSPPVRARASSELVMFHQS
jgi:hypothetical protein